MVFFLFVENCLVERDECSRMSRIESLPYSLSNTAIDDLLGLALVRGPWNARLSERRARRGAGQRGGAGPMGHASTYAGMPRRRKSTSVNKGGGKAGPLVTGDGPLYSEMALMASGRASVEG